MCWFYIALPLRSKHATMIYCDFWVTYWLLCIAEFFHLRILKGAREFQKKLFLNVSLCFLRFVTLFLLLNISFIILRIAKWCIPYTDIVYWKWCISSNCFSKSYKPKYTRHFSFEISVYFQSPHVATFLFRLVNLLYDPYHIAHTKINVFLLYFLYLVAIFIPGKNPSYKSSSFFFLLCINIFFKDIFWCNNLNFHHYLSKSIYMNV